MIQRARILLIQLGKISPFLVCFIVMISYAEDVYSLCTENFMIYDNSLVLNKPVSWLLGKYFEYNITTVVILLIISVAIRTCYWNKLCILYLLIQLGEKHYFITIELYPEYIYAICIVNIIICTFLCYKGIKQLTKTKEL